jgi:hypothetical protein
MLVVLMSGIGVESLVPRISKIADCVPTAAPTLAKPLADCTPGDPTPPAAAALAGQRHDRRGQWQAGDPVE